MGSASTFAGVTPRMGSDSAQAAPTAAPWRGGEPLVLASAATCAVSTHGPPDPPLKEGEGGLTEGRGRRPHPPLAGSHRDH